ncbi:hypothetical protein BV22DRAFT_999355 [Leucogyrophana mollusca]|uniref:Uncharacterized protein n=1 Tax=Leucogyrophana mollusca TaxID=85980 RepID=A0ACB8C1A7_9AGAM|nr:hypothetical protein BV22DRAFT_999355 [Leucogyrophana mollusca]
MVQLLSVDDRRSRRDGTSNDSPRHRPHLSASSNLSAIADSTISFSTIATGETLRLSEFPQPPTDIPITPRKSEFVIPSPVRSHFSTAEPPTSSSSRRSSTIIRDDGAQLRRKAYSIANSAQSSATSAPSPQKASDGSQPPGQIHSGLRALALGKPDPPSPVSVAALSPYDWHEGSSSIVVGEAEDQLLSTSFITSLLSSSPGRLDHSEFRTPQLSVECSSVNPSSPLANDVISTISDMTYPPLSRPTDAGSAENHVLLSPSLSQEATAPERTDQYLNTHLYPVDVDGRMTSTSKRTSASETLHSRRGLLSRSEDRYFYGGSGSEDKFAKGGVSGARMSASSVGEPSYTKVHSMVSAQSAERKDDQKLAEGLHAMDDDGITPPTYEYSMAHATTFLSRSGDREYPSRHASRRSARSVRTVKSYVSSLVSRLPTGMQARRSIVSGRQKVEGWLRIPKPLPPVPTLPTMTIAEERAHRTMEENLPLPTLVDRSDKLSRLLETGTHPRTLAEAYDVAPDRTQRLVPHRKPDHPMDSGGVPEPNSKIRRIPLPLRTKRAITIGGLLLAIVLVLAVSLGVALGRKGKAQACPVGLAGATCTLNATCVCGASTQCLAQSLMDLIPVTNSLFGVNYTLDSLSVSMWEAQLVSDGSSCASQAVLVDIGHAFDSQTFPNRTEWAQAALLWNFAESQDTSATKNMQHFLASAPWSTLGSEDGPVTTPTGGFSTIVSGYIFDFAAQNVMQPNVSFINDGNPSSEQRSQVGSTALAVLDRMYSYASAAATQHQQALANYWQVVLEQDPRSLQTFMAAVRASPIIIPFDATSAPGSQALVSLLTNSSTAPFPPPIGCYPGLSPSQTAIISDLETTVFGLSPINPPSEFEYSCFPDRPIYGVLDISRLRLPFCDSRLGVANQSIVLTPEVASRAIIYVGETLSGLPGVNPSAITSSQRDPRMYGTLEHLDHVLFNFLSSVGNVTQAQALVDFILGNPSVPPNASAPAILASLAELPLIEVAVFGSVTPSDVSSTASSFTGPGDSLFFGSPQAEALRDWAITASDSFISWTVNALSAEIVKDTSFSNPIFNQIWNSVSVFLATHPAGTVVTLNNITSSFASNGMFTSV